MLRSPPYNPDDPPRIDVDDDGIIRCDNVPAARLLSPQTEAGKHAVKIFRRFLEEQSGRF